MFWLGYRARRRTYVKKSEWCFEFTSCLSRVSRLRRFRILTKGIFEFLYCLRLFSDGLILLFNDRLEVVDVGAHVAKVVFQVLNSAAAAKDQDNQPDHNQRPTAQAYRTGTAIIPHFVLLDFRVQMCPLIGTDHPRVPVIDRLFHDTASNRNRPSMLVTIDPSESGMLDLACLLST
jgi:hypothetical protein